jgi:hypothetical protein
VFVIVSVGASIFASMLAGPLCYNFLLKYFSEMRVSYLIDSLTHTQYVEVTKTVTRVGWIMLITQILPTIVAIVVALPQYPEQSAGFFLSALVFVFFSTFSSLSLAAMLMLFTLTCSCLRKLIEQHVAVAAQRRIGDADAYLERHFSLYRACTAYSQCWNSVITFFALDLSIGVIFLVLWAYAHSFSDAASLAVQTSSASMLIFLLVVAVQSTAIITGILYPLVRLNGHFRHVVEAVWGSSELPEEETAALALQIDTLPLGLRFLGSTWTSSSVVSSSLSLTLAIFPVVIRYLTDR